MAFKLKPASFNIISLLISMFLTRGSSVHLMSYGENIYDIALVCLTFFGIKYILILVNKFLFGYNDG